MAFCYSGTSLSKDAYASFNLVIMKESLWLWRLWLGMPFYNYFVQDNFQLFRCESHLEGVTSRFRETSVFGHCPLVLLHIDQTFLWIIEVKKSVGNHWLYLIRGQRISGPIPTLAVSTIAWVDTFSPFHNPLLLIGTVWPMEIITKSEGKNLNAMMIISCLSLFVFHKIGMM